MHRKKPVKLGSRFPMKITSSTSGLTNLGAERGRQRSGVKTKKINDPGERQDPL